MELRDLAKFLVLPPGALIVLALAGLFIARRRRRLGRALVVTAGLLLVILSVPWIGAALLGSLEEAPTLPPHFRPDGERAIVILAADHNADGAEYGGPTVGPMTLERLRYGAFLARSTGLPVLVSGGRAGAGLPTLAGMMADVLAADYGIEARWREEESANTAENARGSAALLADAGIDHVLLVTHGWHMPRAQAVFAAHGMRVTPAPLARQGKACGGLRSFLPSSLGLRESYLALHEWLGRAVYAIHGA
jgi:uncharacterized SAM-binding protein YcdF (DUF218 family)